MLLLDAELNAVLLGLQRVDNYSRHIADCFFGVVRRLFNPDGKFASSTADAPARQQ